MINYFSRWYDLKLDKYVPKYLESRNVAFMDSCGLSHPIINCSGFAAPSFWGFSYEHWKNRTGFSAARKTFLNNSSNLIKAHHTDLKRHKIKRSKTNSTATHYPIYWLFSWALNTHYELWLCLHLLLPVIGAGCREQLLAQNSCTALRISWCNNARLGLS